MIEKLDGPETHLDHLIFLLAIGSGRVRLEDAASVLRAEVMQVREALRRLKERGLITISTEQGETFHILQGPALSAFFPSAAIIPLHYQFNLLCNEERMSTFARAIQMFVNKRSRVLDLGCGTAVLSIIAAQSGADVTAVELDPLVYGVARSFIQRHGFEDKIELTNADALSLQLKKTVDVVICEMLDTGLIAELQVPVMNHAVKNLLRPGGVSIPAGVNCYFSLVEVDFSTVLGLDFPLPHFELADTQRIKKRISNRVPYLSMIFTELNMPNLDKQVTACAVCDGEVNAIVIEMETIVAPGIVASGSPWLNPPLVLPIEPAGAYQGQEFNLHLSYFFGGGIATLKYSLEG